MCHRIPLVIALFFILSMSLSGQPDSIRSRLKFEADFRFRIEQDWDSKKADGTFRADRSRLRYRLRTGVTYAHDWYSFGFRIRTGALNKQQDPQLTLGKGLKEFGTLLIGFEKAFFQGKHSRLAYWIGKNTYPFEKNNELFWSDNVFPEGVHLQYDLISDGSLMEKLALKGGHFILRSNDASFLDDAYLTGVQTALYGFDHRFHIFPSLYLFRNIPNMPDGSHTFLLNYSIVHLGGLIYPTSSKRLAFDFDIYHNLEDYSNNPSIEEQLQDQKNGYSIGVQYGSLQLQHDWMFKVTYTSLQRFSALDYMAQNDWARWDYSGSNSPDGRLTNFSGVELVAGYNINQKLNLIAKYYYVNQLVPLGLARETGQRIRFDLNVSI